MNLTKYAYKMEGTSVDTDGVYGHQCVDLVKDCIKQVFNIQLTSFGGSARTGWFNQSNTFPSDTWTRIENDINKPEQVPIPGDVIFFNTGQYGHVGIVLDAKPGENKITVLDQNTGNGNGQGEDDYIKIQDYTYNNVYGWYNYQMNIRNYKGVEVRMADNVCKENASGCYLIQFNRIILTSWFYTVSRERQEAILEHEYSHQVYFNLNKPYILLWELISSYDTRIRKLLLKRGIKYDSNAYVTNYASSSVVEDFAETWEDIILNPNIKYNDYKDLKRKIVSVIMDRFARTE